MDNQPEPQTLPPETGVDEAVRIAGGQSALARHPLVDVTPQAVQQWVAQGQVSRTKTLAVYRATGVPLHRLRPDSYPAELAA